MAKRRMLNIPIMTDDKFLDMPSSARDLYTHLILAADDDGIVINVKSVMRNTRATEGDARLLLENEYIISIDRYVVISAWLRHNQLRKNRYNASELVEVKKRLSLDTEMNYKLIDSPSEIVYDLHGSPSEIVYNLQELQSLNNGNPLTKSDLMRILQKNNLEISTISGLLLKSKPMADQWQTNGRPLAGPVKLSSVEFSLDKVREVKLSDAENSHTKNNVPRGIFDNVNLTEPEYEKLKKQFVNADGLIDHISDRLHTYGYDMPSHYGFAVKCGKEDGWETVADALKKEKASKETTAIKEQEILDFEAEQQAAADAWYDKKMQELGVSSRAEVDKILYENLGISLSAALKDV